MNLYIHGAGIISAKGNMGDGKFPEAFPAYFTDRLLCAEPDYTSYIPPMQLRRMSKAVRMGIAASKICLMDAEIEQADAISAGTAFGCLHDTETFLSKMVDQEEQMLTPTAFIQSTHNTVAGQIALVTGCLGHNFTYVHRGHSFEHAVINAGLYLNDHKGASVLAGGIEELTETSMAILKRADIYREQPSTPQSVLQGSEQGSIAGEGAAFVCISAKPGKRNNLVLKGLSTFTTREATMALKKTEQFLSEQHIRKDEIDLVMMGINGDRRTEVFYQEMGWHFSQNSQAAFKHLCGEYPVAGSFALGLLSNAIKQGLPSSVILNHPPRQLKRILLINNFVHHYSCWYMEAG